MARPPKQDPGDSFRIQLRSDWRELLDVLVEDGEAGSAADLARDFIKKGLLEMFETKTIREALEVGRARTDNREEATNAAANQLATAQRNYDRHQSGRRSNSSNFIEMPDE